MEKLTALQTIQSKLKVPKIQWNAFGKYSYRNQEDILEGLKPLLTETQCSLTITDDIVMVGDRYYVKATVALHGADNAIIAHTTALAREPESKKGVDASQITGAASSYARKYALSGMFLCDDTKDADALPATNGYITEEQLATIQDYIDKYKVDEKRFVEYLKVKSLKEIPAGSYKAAITALEAKKKAAKNANT